MATTITANGINFPDGSAGSPSIGGSDTNTGLFTGSDIVGFATGGSERLRIDASGNVNIANDSGKLQFGTSADLQIYHDGFDSRIHNLTGNFLIRNEAASGNIFLRTKTSESAIDCIPDGAVKLYFDGSKKFETTSAGATVTGNLGIGTTSPAQNLDVTSTNNIAYALDGWALTGKGDSSDILFGGILGSQFDTLKFYTSGSERVRIDSSGHVGIGLTPADTFNFGKSLDIGSTSGGFYYVRDTDAGSDAVGGIGYSGSGLFIGNEKSDGFIRFSTNNSATERMRITSDGKVGIGTSSPVYRLDIPVSGAVAARFQQTTNNQGDDHACILLRHAAAVSGQDGVGMLFQNSGGTAVGKIDLGQSTTNYRTSSDYRLKENAVSISDGITRLKTLKPYRFNFIVEPDKTVDGFFAHEVTAVPEAISGTKDEVDSDNNPIYQGIDQSKLVPLLVAALQEAIGRIEALEAA